VAAARQVGAELTVASDRPSTFQGANPTGLLTLDFQHPDRAADEVLAFARATPIAGVVGVDDDSAIVAAAIAERLHLRGNVVHAAVAARDKHRQRQLLAAAGVPVPRFELHLLNEDAAPLSRAVRYPCVMKPLRLSASRGVIRADDPEGFVAALARLRAILAEPDAAACGEPARQVLIEEFVPGHEVALEGLVVKGRLRVLALFDKPDPLDGPYFEETIYLVPSRHPAAEQAAAAAVAQAAVTAVGLADGPVHAELRCNDRGPWLIELAARPIGGRCGAVLRFGGGQVTLEEVVVRHALGMALPTLEREPLAAGVMMIPIPGAGVLREVRGVAAAKAVPLVEDVQITAHPGERLVPFPEGSRYPGFIFARGDTPAAVEAALRQAHGRLEFVLS
jgi:biotin carboxylase